jgi:hypothetical protein
MLSFVKSEYPTRSSKRSANCKQKIEIEGAANWKGCGETVIKPNIKRSLQVSKILRKLFLSPYGFLARPTK